MEEISAAISVPFMLSNFIYDGSVLGNHIEVNNFDLTSSKGTLLTKSPVSNLPLVSIVTPTIIDEAIDGGQSSDLTESDLLLSATSLPQEKISRTASQSVNELGPLSLWGCKSVCGKRSEMEDAAVSLPSFLRVPSHKLMADRLSDGTNRDLGHVTGHFFGVYDGHGGSQVANYCCDRVHLALAEEIGIATEVLDNGSSGANSREWWERVFMSCFVKVNGEVEGVRVDRGGIKSFHEPIAPDAVGSTAVVAVICPTHLVVANCGDSRAVLCRGKVPLPLSVDHKPDREDERERIEAAGGKVIQWDGFRVSGVLAMSRSIGDRYLDPYVIPDPEVMLIPRTREDECLVLASDGLWDVMTNEEVCDVARKRILLWHKKNGGDSNLSAGRNEGDPDPAAQDAAEYLCRLALHKGSRDNISVIVVDLKAQRKFKKRI